VLHRHCEAVGRDPGEIQKTVMMLVDPLADLDGFLTLAEQYAALGFDLTNVMPPRWTRGIQWDLRAAWANMLYRGWLNSAWPANRTR
jgi:hypothetical protein